MSIKFIQAEKQINDSVIFPPFDLSVEPSEVVALCTSVNVREQIIDILLGKKLLSNGEILTPKKEIGYFFLNEGFYDRLSLKETLNFYHQLNHSKESIEDIIRLVQLDSKKIKKMKEFTYSEKKRAQLAYILIQNPEVYIMEEPDKI